MGEEMKKWTFALILGTAFHGTSMAGGLSFDPKRPLYLADAVPHGVDETVALLERVAAEGKPIVFYVHGRGDEPGKSLRDDKIVQTLERQYGVKVLMFNWDSKVGGIPPWRYFDRKRPLANVPAAVENLRPVMASIAAYRGAHRQPTMTFLVHSMGSLVVQGYVQKYGWPNGTGGVFDVVLFSEPDADARGHPVWLEPIAVRERVYVTANASDKVLRHSNEAREGTKALGLGPDRPLAKGVTYVELTSLGGRAHRIFNKSERVMDFQVNLCTVLNSILTGTEAPMLVGKTVNFIEDTQIFHLRDQRNRDDGCFRQEKDRKEEGNPDDPG
jgi:hypothetical protein